MQYLRALWENKSRFSCKKKMKYDKIQITYTHTTNRGRHYGYL